MFVHRIRALCTSRKERSRKVFGFAFFKKRMGSRGAEPPKNGAFLFAKLFLLRLLCQKKKRKNDGWCCNDSSHNVRTNIFYPSSWAKRSGVELFCPRSQTSLRSVCSSLRSEFDYAQDDTDKKAPSEARRDLRTINAQCSHKVGWADRQSTHTHSSHKAIGRFVHLAKSDSGKFSSTFFKRWRG